MVRHDTDDLWEKIWENWDEGNVSESVSEIAMATGLSRQTIFANLKKLGFIDMHERKIRTKWETYKTPEPLPECIRWARCPKCGKKMAIERVPFTEFWDLSCLTCGRIPLPRGFKYDGKEK